MFEQRATVTSLGDDKVVGERDRGHDRCVRQNVLRSLAMEREWGLVD